MRHIEFPCSWWETHTPWLDVHGDDRLGSGLGLSGLLASVLGKTLLSYPDGLGILLLVVGTEKVNLVIVLLLGGLLRGLGGVQGELAGVGAVGGVLLGWVTRERRELGLERGNVLVPAVGVGELLDGGLALEGLEGLDVGLRRSVAALTLSVACYHAEVTRQRSNA